MSTPFTTEPDAEFLHCMRTNTTVHQAAAHGFPMERCIIALCAHIREMQARITELEACAPKVVIQSGQKFVWHCPDNLIPESQIQRV